MLKPQIQEALNKQLNAELYSSYLYLSMSAYFDSHTNCDCRLIVLENNRFGN